MLYKIYSYAMAVEEMNRFRQDDDDDLYFDMSDYDDAYCEWMESLRNSEERRLTEDIPSECHPS